MGFGVFHWSSKKYFRHSFRPRWAVAAAAAAAASSRVHAMPQLYRVAARRACRCAIHKVTSSSQRLITSSPPVLLWELGRSSNRGGAHPSWSSRIHRHQSFTGPPPPPPPLIAQKSRSGDRRGATCLHLVCWFFSFPTIHLHFF
jgi:hypothetical protein